MVLWNWMATYRRMKSGILQKNQLQMDQRPQCGTWDSKTTRKKYFENSCSFLTCLCWLLFGLTKLLLFLLTKVKGKMKFLFFLKKYISSVEINYWLSVNEVGCLHTFSPLFDDVNSILRVIPNADTEPTVVSSSHYPHLLWISQTITQGLPYPLITVSQAPAWQDTSCSTIGPTSAFQKTR